MTLFGHSRFAAAELLAEFPPMPDRSAEHDLILQGNTRALFRLGEDLRLMGEYWHEVEASRFMAWRLAS